MTAHRDLEAFLARSREIANSNGGRAKSEQNPGCPPANSANLLISSSPISRLARLATPAGENPPAQPSEWTPEEWAYRFHERAGFLEHDCGHSHQEAEQRALHELEGHWLALHPVAASRPEAGCVHCGSGAGGADLMPRVARQRAHFWLHQRCWPAFERVRRTEARAALAKLIPDLPTKDALDELLEEPIAQAGESQ
jgi:hypothetical protein